jgi:hypothetical protein
MTGQFEWGLIDPGAIARRFAEAIEGVEGPRIGPSGGGTRGVLRASCGIHLEAMRPVRGWRPT